MLFWQHTYSFNIELLYRNDYAMGSVRKRVIEPCQLYQVYQLVDTIDPVDGVVIRASCIQTSQKL